MSYWDIYRSWLESGALEEEEQTELLSIGKEEEEVKSRFFGPLEFGTAGLRGVMGAGLNRMNVHVIRHATQAFANVILAEGEKAVSRGVATCFDCRNHSFDFARAAVFVMA